MALLSLRRALDPVAPGAVVATQETILLDAPAESVDVAWFKALRATDDTDAQVAALDLYRGDLMAPPVSASGLSDYLRTEREGLRESAIAAGLRLVSDCEHSGDTETARAVARKVLAIEPASEPAHRAMMRLFAAANDRAAALRQFAQCRDALRKRYDLGPSAETVALRNRIAGDNEPGPGAAGAPPDGAGEQPESRAAARPAATRPLTRRRLLVAGAAAGGIMLSAAAYYLIASLSGADAPAGRPVVVVSLEFLAGGGQPAFRTAVRAELERVLGAVTGVVFATGVTDTGELAGLGAALNMVDIAVDATETRFRVFARGRQDAAPRELWMERGEFDRRSVGEFGKWLEVTVVPHLPAPPGRGR